MKKAQQTLHFAMLLSLFLFLAGQPASLQAQNRTNVLDRLNNLEAQLQALNGARGVPALGTPASGQAQIALDAAQEQLRRLRGEIEQLQHNMRQQKEQIAQLTREMDLRFNALEAAAQAPPAPANLANNKAPVLSTTPTLSASLTPNTQQPSTHKTSDEAEANANTLSAGEAYKQAFELLNKGQYQQAEQAFSHFIFQHPKHSLLGNAHYWLGETYYVQEQFDAAADEFRKGFQAMAQGPKAPDNLLRLGMTLGVLKREKEACIIFEQLLSKYAGQNQAVERKATHERNKLACQ